MTTEQMVQMLEDELKLIKELAVIHARLVELGNKMEAAAKSTEKPRPAATERGGL